MNLTVIQIDKILKSLMKYSDHEIVQVILNESLDDNRNGILPMEGERENVVAKSHQNGIARNQNGGIL